MHYPPFIRHLFLPAAALLICGTLFNRCNTATSRDTDNDVLKHPSIQQQEPMAVHTTLSKHTMFRLTITTTGKISSLKKLTLKAPFNGTIAFCQAVNGKQVVAAQTLLQLETTAIEHKLDRARLARFNGQQEYESQLLGYERLLKDKTAAEGNTIRQKLMISSGLAIAEQDIKEAQYELSRSTIKVPFTGILADVKVQAGQTVGAGDDLFTLYDPVNLVLEVKALESDIGLIKPGTLATISSLSPGAAACRASVYEINPLVDENGQVLVKLKLQAAPGATTRFYPGMNCTALIGIDLERSLTVPKEAVVERSGKTVVFTLERGEAIWNYVTTGRDNGKEVQIKTGLRPDMKVITSNNLQLSNNAPVQEITDSLKNNQ